MIGISSKRTKFRGIVAVGIFALAGALARPAALAAQGTAPSAAQPATKALDSEMARLSGVWVEGPGFDVTYGGTYDSCARKCLAHERCVMIEYYRPEKKCNLYDAMRPRKTGGSSDVAIRR